MIESRYWREELRGELAWLRKHRTYRRWSEKQQVLFERRLMLCAFQVRSLLERPKVNDEVRARVLQAQRYKKIGSGPFTVMGPGWPHERFDLEHPEAFDLSAVEVCNQLIHNYWLQVWSENRGFAGVLVFSDHKRHKWAYEIQVSDLLRFFSVFADDSSAVVGAHSKWSDEKQDYVFLKTWGANGPTE